MKERPILFTTQMVRALLAGTKTQTRRVLKPQPDACTDKPRHLGDGDWQFVSDINQLADSVSTLRCPYGKPGDRLWVRESWFQRGKWLPQDTPNADADDASWCGTQEIAYAANVKRPGHDWRSRPSIHMPRWASRITLEVTGVRVERLQDISEADAISEGVNVHPDHHEKPRNSIYGPEQAYFDLWESINGSGSWDANPCVWVVEFKRVMP